MRSERKQIEGVVAPRSGIGKGAAAVAAKGEVSVVRSGEVDSRVGPMNGMPRRVFIYQVNGQLDEYLTFGYVID